MRSQLLVSLVVLAAIVVFSMNANAQGKSQEITVAAASDLSFVMQELSGAFHQETGMRVKVSLGSSGNFFAQIQNGAPFDLFFSADIDYPRRLEAAGLAEPGTLYTYATGKLVLWAAKSSPIHVERGFRSLVDPSTTATVTVNKIALANPDHAPYGRAAVSALKHAGVYEQVKDKLVYGENISQAAQFVVSGNADVGILALSLALAPAMADKGNYFLIPQSDYPPLEQAAVVIKASEKKQLARRFLDFLKTPTSVATLKSYGFTLTPKEVPRSGAPYSR